MNNDPKPQVTMKLPREPKPGRARKPPARSAAPLFTPHLLPPFTFHASRFTHHVSRFTSCVSLCLALVGLLLAGCMTPIGADRVSTRRSYDQVDANALGTGKTSAKTVSLLHRYDLD